MLPNTVFKLKTMKSRNRRLQPSQQSKALPQPSQGFKFFYQCGINDLLVFLRPAFVPLKASSSEKKPFSFINSFIFYYFNCPTDVTVSVLCLFLVVPWVVLPFVIMLFPGHTHFFTISGFVCLFD